MPLRCYKIHRNAQPRVAYCNSKTVTIWQHESNHKHLHSITKQKKDLRVNQALPSLVQLHYTVERSIAPGFDQLIARCAVMLSFEHRSEQQLANQNQVLEDTVLEYSFNT